MMPGERRAWIALGIMIWIGVIVYLIATWDTTVICSNNQPC